MESQGSQSLFLPGKEIDDKAKRFIISAYKVGISVELINRFVQEFNYACTISIVQQTLTTVNIILQYHNCSHASLTWRRYLTHILETFNHPTLEQFKEIALDEAKKYYGIDEETFIKYWHEFSKFQTKIIQGDSQNNKINPANYDWMMEAFLYFGYNLTSLSKNLTANKNVITSNAFYGLYREELKRRSYTAEELILYPKPSYTTEVKEFWKSSHRIGGEFHTIIEWTAIFTGRSVTEQIIRHFGNIS